MDFSFVGGALCLDFANTAGWHLSDRPTEHLTSTAALSDWARQAGVINESQQVAGDALDRAIELREALFHVFSRPEATADDLTVINDVLTEAMGSATLFPAGGGLTWGWPALPVVPAARILWPVARSAADLLSSAEARKISMCANGDCGWLFLNPTRRRRWCSMQACGNRAKAARYYDRHKESRA